MSESERQPDREVTKTNNTLILTCALVAIVGIALISLRGADSNLIVALVTGTATQIIQMLRAQLSDKTKKADTEAMKAELRKIVNQTNGIMDERIKMLIAVPMKQNAEAMGKIAEDVAKLQQNAVILPRQQPLPNPPMNP